MDQHHLAVVTRSLTRVPSRRDVLRGLVGAGLGLAMARFPIVVAAKRKRRKKKKARPNAFGCLEVGDPCQNADQCCSGICEGKKGTRRCRARGVGTCDQQALGWCRADTLKCNNSQDCACIRTTAGSNFCVQLNVPDEEICADCQRDADCEVLGFPAGSACAPFSVGICAGACESGMACVPPCGYVPSDLA